MFTTLDLSLNQYHHVFFQVEPDTSNVLTTYMYDNAMNSLGTIDVSFGTQSIVSALTSFDQNGANPYAIGVDHTGSTKVNMDLAFWGMYTSALKDRQRQTLMKFTNQTLLEPHSQATIYMVTVENGKFYVDDDAQPILVFAPGYYVFDQRHASNATHPLLLSTTANGIHGGGTEYTTGVVKNGTPGSLNAYTLIQVTENTPDLFYYCANHSNMGGTFTQVDAMYYVKVVQNVLGEYVYALSTSANGPYYNQKDLSFNAGENYLFNVGDSSNDGYRLEFGTTVDDVATINTANVVRDEDEIVLNLSGYTGDALYYFEDTSGGMGYVPPTLSGNVSENKGQIVFPDANINFNISSSVSVTSDNPSYPYYHVDYSPQRIMNEITNFTGSESYKNGKYILSSVKPDGLHGNYTSGVELLFGQPYGSYLPISSASGGPDPFGTFESATTFTATAENTIVDYGGYDITVQNKDNTGSSGVITADWIQFECPFRIHVSEIVFTPRFADAGPANAYRRHFGEFYVLGSNTEMTWNGTSWDNNATWNHIVRITRENTSNNTITIYDQVANTDSNAYKYIMIAFTKMQKNGHTTSHNLNLRECQVTGTVYADTNIEKQSFVVTVVGGVFDLSGTPQLEVPFTAGESYVFHQSDPTNDGYQIVFGTTPDAPDNYVTGKTVMGTPGQEGAYTQLELPADFTGSLFYYHDTIPYMGYGPMTLSTDLSSAGYGDVVTFTVTNRTGVAETYTITGVVSADISGASLSGSIGYGQQVDLSYVITGSDKTMVFSVGDLSANVNILINYNYEFAVQTNILGDPVFAVYDVSDSVYYNQPDLSFSAPNMYQFDLSSSVVDGGYTLVFGTEVDNSGTVVEGGYVTRETGKVILDLREYTGDALYYFEDTSGGMGYVTYQVNATESFGTLEGEAANEHFGNQISLNADGTRIVVFSGSNKVKCFEYSNGSWTQLGSTITTSNSTVSMDASGNSISIANISFAQGYSYVYDLDGTNEWQLRGGTSFVTGSNKGSNHASKLSGNGEYFWSTGWTNYGRGFAFQYYYDGSSWVTTRSSAYGQFPRTYHIDTNYDGSVCVGTASNTDQFLVFPPTGTTIIQPTNISGNAISANLDGTRVAMVSGDSQYVRVYDKGADWSTWTLVGSAVSVTDMSTIALSDDGLRFVVGNPEYDLSNGTQDTGIIQVYDLQNGVWTMLYEETGTTTSDSVGRSVGISQFGAVIANGRYDADALTNLGSVDILGLNDPSSFDVTVSGGVFVLSGISRRAVSFSAYGKYFFDQSDPTNAGQTIVFGRTPDDPVRFTEGVTIMGSAGQQGAYTQIDLSDGFTGNLYYFSDVSAGMGMMN